MVLSQVHGIEVLLHLLIELIGFLRGLQVCQQHTLQYQVFFLQVVEATEEGIRRGERRDVHIGRTCLLQNPAQQSQSMKATPQMRLQRVRGQRTQDFTRTRALAHSLQVFQEQT